MGAGVTAEDLADREEARVETARSAALASAARSRSWALALTGCTVLFAERAFHWDLVEVVTPVFGGLLKGTAWAVAGAISFWLLVRAVRGPVRGVRRIGPFLFSVAVLAAAWYMPWTQFWLTANFIFKREAREQVVTDIRRGKLTPNVPYNPQLIALPEGSGLSKGGDQVVVQGLPDAPYIFFYTYRGLLDNYSGFLWVPFGGSPGRYQDAADPGTEIQRFPGNWYFIGHK